MMDYYLKNTLFAGNLLEYLFKQQLIPWENPHKTVLSEQVSPFDVEIGVAVNTIWKENERDIYRCYSELFKVGVEDKETFAKCAVSAADMYFSDGYNPGSFLGYCAIILGVSTIFYGFPSNGVPEIAAEVISLVLLAHQLTGQFENHDGWEGLRKISKEFNELYYENPIENEAQ